MRFRLAGLWLTAALAACSGDDAASAGSGGAGGGGGTGSGGASGAGSGGSGGGGVGGASGMDGGTSCGEPCDGSFSAYAVGCCGGRCVGLYNDPTNCGACGTVCPASAPHCNNGKCEVPPTCSGITCPPGESCCGSACCEAGQLCCGVNIGPFIHQCHTPTESEPSCPIGCPSCLCASPDTSIATPDGERAIASLSAGDLVYSLDEGALTVVPIAHVTRTSAQNHHVVRATLANGATLEISPGHPTADGRTFGDLSAGSSLFGVEVLRIEIIPYAHAFTYDILPASDSGTYVAGGVLIGSTLALPGL